MVVPCIRQYEVFKVFTEYITISALDRINSFISIFNHTTFVVDNVCVIAVTAIHHPTHDCADCISCAIAGNHISAKAVNRIRADQSQVFNKF